MPMSVFVEESGSTAVIIAVLIAAVMTCFFGTRCSGQDFYVRFCYSAGQPPRSSLFDLWSAAGFDLESTS